jgi:RNA recognition motif-containing protein
LSTTSKTKTSEDGNSDERSVFVKNVHFRATQDQLIEHFKECGGIKRVTIAVEKATQTAKG